jgi:CheY-like chemotaxis protein
MGCALPIIGVTGNLLPDDVSYYKAQGADDVLGKPLSLAKFEEFMRAYAINLRHQLPGSHHRVQDEVSLFEEAC